MLRDLETFREYKILKSETKSEWILSEVLNSLVDAVILIDDRGIIRYWNAAAESMFGYTKEEAIGKELHKVLIPKSFHRIYKKRFKSFVKTGLGPFVGKTMELEAVRKDGTVFPVELSLSKFQMRGIWYAVGVVRDVTERRRAEDRIKHLNRMLRAIGVINQIINREKDRERLLKEVCRGLVESQVYHYAWIVLLDESGEVVAKAESGLGKVFLQVVEHLKCGGLTCARRALAHSDVVIIRDPPFCCFGCPLAESYHNRAVMTVRLEHDGKVYGVLSASTLKECLLEEESSLFKEVAKDIAYSLHLLEVDEERRRMEEELARERDFLRILMENIPDAIYFKDDKSRFTRVNRAHAQRMGLKNPEEAIGKTDFDFYAEEFAQEAYRDEERILKSGQPLIGKIEKVKTRDGKIRWVSATKVPIRDKDGRVIGIVGISRDITKQKEAEERVRESEEKYKNLFENARDIIILIDLNGKITAVNRIVKEYGFKKEEIVGKSVFNFVPKKYWSRLLKDFTRVVRGKIVKGEISIVTPRGKVMLEYRSNPITKGAKVIGVQAILRDVTERRKMEDVLRRYSGQLERLVWERTRQLRESERKYRSLIEHIPDVTWTSTKDGKTVFISPNVKKVYGYTPEEIYEKGASLWFERIHPDDVERVKEAYKALFEKGVPYDIEYRIKRKDGKWIWIYDRAVSTYKKDGVWYADGVFSDITKRVEMEEQLKNAERMAAIGETAAMVAHDLRNPLQAMVGLLYLARRKIESSTCTSEEKLTLKDLFRKAEKQVQYMNKIVSDLREYARPLKPDLRETSLRELIDSSLSSLTVPENVKLSIKVEENLPKLMVDPALMNRVFTNLILNALQAMPDGGRLRIKASKEGRYVLISVEDSGVGIPEENMPKLFQPLFTTKAKGQGFGLPVCKRIVEAHGGEITVKSQLGKGSTFTIKIPLERR